MAEVACDSDSDIEVTAQSRPSPPPKRRRVLDPSAITPVPIYSKKVTRSLQLNPAVFKQVDCTEVNEDEDRLWPPFPPKSKNKPISIILSDSEEELEPDKPQLVSQTPSSPPPHCIPPVLKTNRANKKIRQINQKLATFSSLMCLTSKRPEDIPDFSDCSSQINKCHDDENEIIIISSEDKKKRRPAKPKPRKRAREISLKFRWRMDVHKIPVLLTDPLSKAVAQLSVKLKVPASKILLMRNDDELPVHSTITQLDLGIADIIDCLVITDDEDESRCDVITVRLQGKEKGSAQEYSLRKDAPLGSILSQYTSGLSATAKRKVKVLFDGLKVKHNQTPSQLDMEDGDVIDVWA
ncbi:hypothetical protein PDJAM_G00044670 [Pangasius djambal]|uniref:Uncharacterized protein n=1 Tax=Pangasius djambal TaxID=1691987 RepID=A0ACC5YV68_9TELE|nr:hypothetical protein [Pangasius djambal]